MKQIAGEQRAGGQGAEGQGTGGTQESKQEDRNMVQEARDLEDRQSQKTREIKTA